MNKQDKYDTFNRYLFYFLTFSFIGWVFETLAVFVTSGKLTARGYFFIGPRLIEAFKTSNFNLFSLPGPGPVIFGLPAIEMYGIGGLLIIILLKRYKSSLLKTFVYGALVMTVFELIGSYWCDFFLGRKYWNYHKEFLNFEGRICLQSSIAWGILAVIAINLFEPILEKLYDRVKKKNHYQIVLLFFGVLMIFCACIKYIFFTDLMVN